MTLPINLVSWRPCWRIIPSRFGPIAWFERLIGPHDNLEELLALDSLTNPNLRHEVGALHMVRPGDRMTGAGTGYIMAAFTHLNPAGSRFSDGNYGVFYAAYMLDTAIAETRYHRERFMQATSEPSMELGMRVLLVDLHQHLHDIRGMRSQRPALYAPDDYGAAQALANRLRTQSSWGIAYDSVRHPGGECAALFRPPALSNCREEGYFVYVWDGTRIRSVERRNSV